MARPFWIAALVAVLVVAAWADADSHTYEEGEEVILWVNKIGPYNNPQETYTFYDTVPLCPPKELEESRLEGLGEALQGYELIKSNMRINFKDHGANKKTFCKLQITSEIEEQLTYVILNKYWFEFFLDDLPVWGFVGDAADDGRPMIYTHLVFTISYNEDRVIEVKLSEENPVEVKADATINFQYTVQWTPTDVEFEHRFDKYLDDKFFEHQVHWFSIFNSFMMVFFLVGLVIMILIRTLKQDYAKYAKDADEEDGLEGADDGGWKQVHGDVFRAPPYLSVFSALIGTGTQLVILAFCLIFLSVGFYHERGSIVTAMIVCYAFTSFISGYVGGSYYIKNGGRRWIKTMLYTALLLPGVVSGVAFVLNWVAIAYGSLAAIPFTTMLVVILIWLFIAMPLTFFGTIIGRNWAGAPDYPCRINPVPRLIPEKSWHQEPAIHVILGGLLPFGSIFIEMYFVFTAFWQYKYYYVFGFLFLVYMIMIVVSVCVTIVSTYFLLNSEDYRWQWTSFGASFSTAGYVFLYSVYYFFARTHMTGFMQVTFYFGYMTLFCLTVGLVCGAAGFLGAEMFVRRIYRDIKID